MNVSSNDPNPGALLREGAPQIPDRPLTALLPEEKGGDEGDSAWFRDRVVAIATMHHKEKVIAPLLERELGVKCVVPDGLNTDRFGTFTRDVARPAHQIETARLKANAALELTGATVAIASEGAFGPHPAFPFLPCNREVLVLVDQQHGLEIVGEAISTETNFNHAIVETIAEATHFAQKVRFPDHALVVMPDAKTAEPSYIIKGITNEAQLIEAVTDTLAQWGRAHLETDMRAMHNPTRMNVIEQATQDLVRKATQHCLQCNSPGFDVVQRQEGLRCALCCQPTTQTLAHIYICQTCGFSHQKQFPDGMEVADPMYCSFCNP